MTIAQHILDQAKIIMQDPDGVRYPDTELLDWLNQGLQEVVNYKPDAYIKTVAHQLVAGPVQTLPDDAAALLTITHNVGNGSTIGPVVTPVKRALMDGYMPTWMRATASGTVKHYMYDHDGDDMTFYVFPPQPATPTKVSLRYFAVPDDVAATDELPFATAYDSALLDYVLYRCYNKEIEQGDGLGLASAHFKAFLSSLSGKTTAEGSTQTSTGG